MVSPSDFADFRDYLKYISGGGTAVAGGAVDSAQVTIVNEDGTRNTVIDPVTGLPLHFSSGDPGWANVYAYLAQTGQLPFDTTYGGGGGGGGYGYGYGGGGGGGEVKYYPQFDYNQAQGLWNDYITKQGFGGQDRMGDWARSYFDQTLLDFNSDFTGKNPPKEIPVEGTTEAPPMAQTSDYAKYLKNIYNDGTIRDIYTSLPAARRGDNYAQFSGSGRTLAWG